MVKCPELPQDVWEIILDHLKLISHCEGIKWSPSIYIPITCNGVALPLLPYSQIKFVNKLFYSKLYFPPPPSPHNDPYLPLPSPPPPIAIRYHNVKINLEFAPPSEDENKHE